VNVRINELSSSNHYYQDEAGDTDDWLELYNVNEGPANLSGYYISDSGNKRFKTMLTDEAVVPGHGLLLLWADQQPTQGDLHLDFKLSSSGDGVWLSDLDGYVVDHVEFNAVPPNDAGTEDTSLARFPDGTGSFQWCSQDSPEKLNGTHCNKESL
jgi:hypothetical protein